MSEYLYLLEVPAEKRSFTVAEALEATSSALHHAPSQSEAQSGPEFQANLRREVAYEAHLDALKRAVNSGVIDLRNPLTGVPSDSGWVGDADSWLLTRADLKVLCDSLAIELTEAPKPSAHFTKVARPLAVPDDLQALPNEARITYQERIGRQRGIGACRADEFRAEIQSTIARQSEGYFTINEAAQVLADSRPGLDPAEVVRHLLQAHSRGELAIRHRESHFRLAASETPRDFSDTVEVGELDAWLRTAAGYGFPISERACVPLQTAESSIERHSGPNNSTRRKPAQVFQAQEDEVLKVIRLLGYKPMKLPPRTPGKPWVKSEVWRQIGVCQLFISQGVFEKAWDRLRKSGEIADRPGL